MEDVGPFYGHLVHFTAFWYILWQFGYFMFIWYVFTRFGMLYQGKSGNTGVEEEARIADRLRGRASETFQGSSLYLGRCLSTCQV
jgi:hypothetical protein